MIRFGFPYPEQQLLPIELVILTLLSFTTLIYQYDSIALTGDPSRDFPSAWNNNRVLLLSFTAAFFCSVYSFTVLPTYLYEEMIFGIALITIYFLPLKWVRYLLDRVHLIRWAFLSTIIGGAGVIVAGTTESFFCALLLVVPLICGNLMVCDYRDSEVDLYDPQRNAFSAEESVVKKLIVVLFTLSLASVTLVQQWHEISAERWIISDAIGFGILWYACQQKSQPWRLTLIADSALFVTFILLILI